uniref:Uncharacterized protein n=2 Tax=Phaseolus vulgaris TaxID=3885 RepID=V7BJ30_PHAVU|nr:hypothetical protein PHAVU_006G004500g [Phaseolus vulgaris]ESW17994.1 hypothetical protein PHAVU_006G004500g [Phaseolus vulgaris]
MYTVKAQVQESKHSWETGEEECLCTFILFWLHGPNARNLTTSSIENICVVQPRWELDPVLASFLDMVKQNIELFSACPVLVSTGDYDLEMVTYGNKIPNTTHRMSCFVKRKKEAQHYEQRTINVCSDKALIVATAFFPSLFSIGHHLAPLIVTATAIGCRQLPLETADHRWKPLTVAGNYRRILPRGRLLELLKEQDGLYYLQHEENKKCVRLHAHTSNLQQGLESWSSSQIWLQHRRFVPKEDFGFDMVPYCNKRSNTTSKFTYFGRMIKETQRARRSVANACSPEVSCHDRRMEERDLEGTKNMCMILITNIDKELCPSTVTEFLRRHTSLSVRVFIFPSLSMEVYTRGAIMVHSEKEFQELCDVLNNPNCIITSSTGRPWVILEKLVGLKNIKASIGALVHISEEEKKGRRNNLKIVDSGTKEFKIASIMRDLFWAFSEHQERLQKRLAVEERRIFAANQQLA